MNTKMRAGTSGNSSDSSGAPFSLSGTLSSYEVEEIKPRQVARLLAELKRPTSVPGLIPNERDLSK